jgi:hypothetical protein
MDPSRTPYTLELLSIAQTLANLVEMRFKYALRCKRPFEYSAQIQPMIWTPPHASLPSGHSTESFTMARLLWLLMREVGKYPYNDIEFGKMLMRQAARIAINRTVAGLHFPVDSIAGCVLGLTLAAYLYARCGSPNAFPVEFTGWLFDGAVFSGDEDFFWNHLYGVVDDTQQKVDPWVTQIAADPATISAGSALLRWLWERAKEEWA